MCNIARFTITLAKTNSTKTKSDIYPHVPKLSAYVDAVRKMGHADPRKLSIVVITPNLADSEGLDIRYKAIEENLDLFYKRRKEKIIHGHKAWSDAKKEIPPSEPTPLPDRREIVTTGSSGKAHKTIVTTKK